MTNSDIIDAILKIIVGGFSKPLAFYYYEFYLTFVGCHKSISAK